MGFPVIISRLFVPKVGATNDFDLAENLNKNKNNIYVMKLFEWNICLTMSLAPLRKINYPYSVPYHHQTVTWL